jgi:hypothetical protein
MDISNKINEPIQERSQMQISSDQDHSYKKRQYNNTNIYSVFWDKEKERLSHVIDLYYKYEMLVEDRQEFTKHYQNKYADQVSIWFEDEMKNVNFQKGKNDEQGIISSSTGNTFPYRDLNCFINEIQVLNINRRTDQGGWETFYYEPHKEGYIDKLISLNQKALCEIKLFSRERITIQLIHLEQFEKRIASTHRFLISKVENKSAHFDFGYLNDLFKFPKYSCERASTVFLNDVCYAISLKHNSILDYIEQVKDFIESPQSNNQIDSLNSENNKSYNTYIPAAYKYKKYNVLLSAITDLLQFLIARGFVTQETDISDFRKIFNDTKPDKPIQWLAGIESLSYFIKLLHHDFKLIEPLGKNIWKVTAELFVDKNYHHFEWKKFRNQKTPARAELIQRAIVHLKK